MAQLSKALKEESITLSKKIQIVSLTLRNSENDSFQSEDNNENNEESFTDGEDVYDEERGNSKNLFEKRILQNFSEIEEHFEDFEDIDSITEVKKEEKKKKKKKNTEEILMNAEWQLKMRNLFDSEIRPNLMESLLIVILYKK